MSTKPLAVPSDHGVGLHDDQGGAPILPTLGEEDPEQSVRRSELRTFHRSRQHGRLLTEREVRRRADQREHRGSLDDDAIWPEPPLQLNPTCHRAERSTIGSDRTLHPECKNHDLAKIQEMLENLQFAMHRISFCGVQAKFCGTFARIEFLRTMGRK